MAASVGLLAACSDLKETDFFEKDAYDGDLVESIIFEVPDIYAISDDETRASLSQDAEGIHFAWEAMDTVGIFPDKGSQVYFEMADGVGSNVARFNGGGWALREDSKYACYYPFVCDMKLNRDAIPVSFAGQAQNGVSNYEGARFVLASEGTSSSTGSLTFSFQILNTFIRIRALGLPAGNYTKLTLETEEPLFVQEGTFGLGDMKITGKTYSNTLELALKDFVLTEESTEENPALFYLFSAPVDLSGKKVTVRVYSEDGGIYECERTPKNPCVAGSWTGWKCVMKNNSTTYSKASSISVGGAYLIVDAGDQKLFKGASDGSYLSVSPKDNVIIDTDNSLAGYEFTVENNGSNYYLKFNDGKYLICNYTSGSSSGLAYVDTQSAVTYPYALSTGANGAFFFSTAQMNSPSTTNQVLYYKSDAGYFKIGGSGTSLGVHLYLRDGKLDRSLGFNPESVTCNLGDKPEKPVLSGIYETVAYSSSDESVATVNANGDVTVITNGTVTITATVAEDSEYNAGSASYSLIIKKQKTTDQYVRVTSADQINVEGEYVLVYDDGSTRKVFKPVLNDDKNTFSTTSNNARDVVIDDDEIEASEVDDCRIMLANQEGTTKKFALVVPEADGAVDYYLVLYMSPTVFLASTTETGYRSTFNLSPEGVLTLNGNSGYNFKYTNGSFTASTGASTNLYLYVRTGGSVKEKQSLSFKQETVSWSLGDGYETGKSYAPQQVDGARTTVTYTAEPESVAKIENGKIRIVSAGTVTITATAANTDQYYAASASYTLRILKGGWVDLGSFNLENNALYNYLNEASGSYSDTNDDTVTVMDKYVSGTYASMSRKDCPAPVTISWTNSASGSTIISIFENDSLDNPVWTQDASANTTSADVYNLIPGRKYYYTVSENSTIWEKGYFSTTGRRRMLKVSNSKGRGYANNCRDLGGLEVTDKGVKKTIQYGHLFRGTNMDKTTKDAEWPILLGFMDVGMDIDLRNGTTNGTSFGSEGSFNRYRPLPEDVAYTAPGFMDSNNFQDMTVNEKVYAVVMAFINTVKSGKAVYFHCYSGADRTGYIAMLIEGLLGVSEKDCSIDYELTSFCESVGGRYRTGKPTDYDFRDGIAFLRKLPGDTFQDKIETYLVGTVGISQDDINDFKSRVLE